MSIPPESIQVGQCYLMLDGEVRRVLRLLPNQGVHYESRAGGLSKPSAVKLAYWRSQPSRLWSTGPCPVTGRQAAMEIAQQ